MAVTNLHDIPGTHIDHIAVPAIASSAATNYVAVWTAPFKCSVTGARFVCTDAVTGVDTNTVHLNLDGPSSATEIGTLDLDNGTDLVAGVASAFTVASAVSFTANQSLRLEAEEVGTGLAAGAIAISTLIIEYQGN